MRIFALCCLGYHIEIVMNFFTLIVCLKKLYVLKFCVASGVVTEVVVIGICVPFIYVMHAIPVG